MSFNPFRKFLTKEHLFHEALINYIRMQYPKSFVTHHPNESRKTKFEQFLYKILGVKSGMPDVLIFTPSNGHYGLAIELKVGTNKPTTVQKQCMADLAKCNWLVLVSYSFDDARKIIDNYFRIKF